MYKIFTHFGNLFFFSFQLYSAETSSKEREPSAKTLRSPLSNNFSRHCIKCELNGGTRRHALSVFAEGGSKNNLLLSVEMEPNTGALTVRCCISAPTMA